MNVYNLELVRNNEIRKYVTHKQDVLSVYCWHVILFDIFFHNADVCIFAKTMHCLIIYLYKTNPWFSPCPWNLRSIGPSDFKSLCIFVLINSLTISASNTQVPLCVVFPFSALFSIKPFWLKLWHPEGSNYDLIYASLQAVKTWALKADGSKYSHKRVHPF